MKNRVTVLALCTIFSGCASQYVRYPINADITYGPWHNVEAVESVRFPSKADGGDAAFCVARHVSNKSVTLQDSSNSWTGPVTGKYYHVEKTQQADGGDVLVAESSSGLVAQGSTRYQASTFVERAVRFTLTVTPGQYEFSNIEHAQINTGAVSNAGYGKIGSWKAANPDLAVASLKQIAQQLDGCMSTTQ